MVCRLFGRYGAAGVLLCPGNPRANPGEAYRYVLVSTSSDFPTIESLDDNILGEGIDCNMLSETYEARLFEDATTYNIMLVQLTAKGYYERLAVGQFHKDVWLEADPVLEKIYIG
jgi:hypothetical protein